jgi:hypothetical protein
VKSIEDATIPFNLLLDRRMQSTERVSKSLLDQGIGEVLLKVVNMSPRRVNDYVRDKSLDETGFADILQRFVTAEGERNSITKLCAMEKVRICRLRIQTVY